VCALCLGVCASRRSAKPCAHVWFSELEWLRRVASKQQHLNEERSVGRDEAEAREGGSTAEARLKVLLIIVRPDQIRSDQGRAASMPAVALIAFATAVAAALTALATAAAVALAGAAAAAIALAAVAAAVAAVAACACFWRLYM